MKQDVFIGFGPTGEVWRAPQDMDADVLVLCNSEAEAIRWSLQFAQHKFGFDQKDIARRMGLLSRSHLSEWKREGRVMPEKHHKPFAYATGCNLLTQFIARRDAELMRLGEITDNQRDRIVVARMLRCA